MRVLSFTFTLRITWRKYKTKLLLILLLIFFLLMLMKYKTENACIIAVKGVNADLTNLAMYKQCEKQKQNTAKSCNAYEEKSKARSTEDYLDSKLDNCHQYIQDTRVPYNSQYEAQIPLAFSLVAHKDGVNLSKLLSAIFRPWNSYCIQLDSKSSPKFVRVMTKLVRCYNSVYNNSTIFLSERPLSIIWNHISLLEADLGCLEQLQLRDHAWKYFVNIAGSEYPLISNYELIKKLESVENKIGFVKSDFPWSGLDTRWKYSHRLPDGGARDSSISLFGGYYNYQPHQTDSLKSGPPLNLTIMVGVKNVAITRHFSNFILQSSIGKVMKNK